MARNRSWDDDEDDDRPRSRRRTEDDSDDRDDDDRPRRRASPKKKDNTTMIVLLVLGGVFVLTLLVCSGIGAYAFISARRAVAEQQAKVQAEFERARQQAQAQAQAQNQAQIAAEDNDMGRAKKAAADMVAKLKQAQFDAAYNLTSPSYKSKTTLAQFTSLMKPIADEFGPLAPTVLPEDPFASKTGSQYTYKIFWTGTQDVQFVLKNNNGTWQIDQINTKLSWFGQQKQKQK